MRKKVFGRHLSRGRKSRTALFRSLIRALVLDGKITTTRAKAKAVVSQIDKLITTAKKETVSARRQVLAKLGNDRKATDGLFERVVPAASGRKSGYTRIISLPPRRGDRAQMVIMEWVDRQEEVVAKKGKEKGKEKGKKKEKKTLGKKRSVKTGEVKKAGKTGKSKEEKKKK